MTECNQEVFSFASHFSRRVEASFTAGRGFDIRVIAECVERQDSWQLLQDLGCNSIQGYGVSRPVPPASFDHWRAEWPIQLDKSAMQTLSSDAR
jgi:EAL domain-containing protein (putative c-di-GMP-specific phosphodiesterase class I)